MPATRKLLTAYAIHYTYGMQYKYHRQLTVRALFNRRYNENQVKCPSTPLPTIQVQYYILQIAHRQLELVTDDRRSTYTQHNRCHEKVLRKYFTLLQSSSTNRVLNHTCVKFDTRFLRNVTQFWVWSYPNEHLQTISVKKESKSKFRQQLAHYGVKHEMSQSVRLFAFSVKKISVNFWYLPPKRPKLRIQITLYLAIRTLAQTSWTEMQDFWGR